MPDNIELTEDLKSLEAALGSLCPQPAQMDRGEILYEAGRAAGLAEQASRATVRPRWLVATTAAALLISLTTTLLWLNANRAQQVVIEALPPVEKVITPREEAVVAEIPAPTTAQEIERTSEYFALRQVVLEQGVDALPQPKFSSNTTRPDPTLRNAMEGI